MSRKFLLILLSFTFMASKAQNSSISKNVSSFSMYIPQLQCEKKIWVYLPYNYMETDKRFPVIYMHDGQNLFSDAFSNAGEWHIDEKLDSLKAQAIVIGIEHGGEKRLDELTPYKNEKYGGGHANNYLDYVATTLKPHIDDNFRTLKDRDNTVIFGSSVGGLASFYALLKFPKVFGKAGVFSPSFWFSEEIYDYVHKTDKINAKIYFMAGDHESTEMVPDLDRMYDIAKHKVKDKKQLHKRIVYNGRHNETLWANEFVAAYLWLMEN